jgi:UDP-N-acetylmuramate dehydrogenase
MHPQVQTNAPIPTWFGVGGAADRLARPASLDELRACLDLDPALVVLGDGANLLVHDEGVDRLVVALTDPAFRRVDIDENSGIVLAGAGADLRKLITETVRRGLAGLEVLAGIPAGVGGAAVMNAGGSFGQFADAVEAVHALDRSGREVVLGRDRIPFDYRRSGLEHLLVTAVRFRLRPVGDAGRQHLRDRLLEVSDCKRKSQPLSANSAGCAFKNPTLTAPLRLDTGERFQPGQRVSAGLLLDRAGCKGLEHGWASVSGVHANFITARPGGRAADVIALMDACAARVQDRFGVTLHREVVVWGRSSRATSTIASARPPAP